MSRSRHRGWLDGVAAPLVLAVVMLFAFDSPAQKVARADEAQATVPFRVGEKLDYRVGWQSFPSAATAQVRVEERGPFYGRTAWHFQASARTVEPVRYLYTLDDQFDSYTDTAALASLQYETYLREMGRQENSRIRMGTESIPSAADGPTVLVPPGTQDPLGAFFSLRAVDWQQAAEIRMPVYDGRKLYELRARKVGDEETVTVPAGEFSAMRIEMHVYERNRELAGTRFRLWLAQNAARTPVRVDAELPFGTFRVELTRVQ